MQAAATRAVVLHRLARWGFPFLSVGAALASQVVVPRVLQVGLSEPVYTAYVAVMSLSAYVSFAEGGFTVSFLREIAALHGAGDKAGLAGEVRRAGVVFLGSALVGLAIAAFFLDAVLDAAAAAWSPGAGDDFRRAAWGVFGSAALAMAGGSAHTALLLGTGRFFTHQTVGLATTLAPTVSLIVAVVATRDLMSGLWAFTATTGLIACLRAAHARWLFLRETAGVARPEPRGPLSKVLTAGITLRAADSLPQAAYPHLLTLIAAPFVPVLVPARTLANGCRLVSQLFVNLLGVHITRTLAGSAANQARAYRDFAIASRFLCALQLALLGAVALGAEAVFQLWLPNQTDLVASALPGMLGEQALLSAWLPSSALLMGEGRLRLLGTVRVAGVLAALLVLVIALPRWPLAAFGYALMVSSVPPFVLGAWTELRADDPTGEARRSVAVRYGVAFVVAVLVCTYGYFELTVSLVILAIGLGWLPRAALDVWRELWSTRSASTEAG